MAGTRRLPAGYSYLSDNELPGFQLLHLTLDSYLWGDRILGL
jgi:hypothetical protein